MLLMVVVAIMWLTAFVIIKLLMLLCMIMYCVCIVYNILQ